MELFNLFLMKKVLISVIGLSLVFGMFTACGGGSEKDRFVSASVEVGCAMFEDPQFFNDMTLVEQKTREIFAKKGFDIDDDVAMEELANKYQYDEDVIKQVQEGITTCAGDIFGSLMNDADLGDLGVGTDAEVEVDAEE